MGDMNIAAGRMRTRERIALWALAGVALLISHDAVWLTQIGPGEGLASALRSAGHGYWGLASLALVLIGLAAAIGVDIRLRLLRRRAKRIGAAATGMPARPYLNRAVAAWLRLFALVAIGFVMQENVEHFLSHQHTPGIGALIGPEYPLALPVIAAITAMGGLIAAAVRTAERQLIAAILAAVRRLAPRAPQRLNRSPARVVWRSVSPLAASWAGRAPPRQLFTHS